MEVNRYDQEISTIKLVLIGIMIWGILNERVYETRLAVLPDMELV